MRRYTVRLTTASDGTVTGYTPYVNGELHAIHYVKDGANAYTDGVDFTITDEATGESLWTEANVNASASRYPGAATHSNVGAAALYATSGTPVQRRPGLARTRVKIALAQGGASKVGSFHVLVA